MSFSNEKKSRSRWIDKIQAKPAPGFQKGCRTGRHLERSSVVGTGDTLFKETDKILSGHEFRQFLINHDRQIDR